jgi:hypothetical protein
MRTVVLALVLLVVLVCTVAEPLAPTATLSAPEVLGASTPI